MAKVGAGSQLTISERELTWAGARKSPPTSALPITFYATVPAGGLRPSMPPVAVLLSAASFARFRHGEFGLFRRPTVPAHIREVAADSGGFVAARRFGDYDFLAIQYVEWLYSFGPRWAATMDYPVEPELAADERAVRERQERTTELATFLWDQFPDAPWAWVPTVQGWSVDDYARHAEDLAPLVMEMRHEYNPWSWIATTPRRMRGPPASFMRFGLASGRCVGARIRTSSERSSSPSPRRSRACPSTCGVSR
jgi:hypothetical protein